jgi:hypothetical protein
LEIIQKYAGAEDGRGWRAAAWMLERLFPGDYAPRMKERFAYQQYEAERREREEGAALPETPGDDQPTREARFARANQEYEQGLAADEAQQAAASESASHNSRKAGEAEPRHPQGHCGEQAAPTSAPRGSSEGASHNSRNAVEEEEGLLAQALLTAARDARNAARPAVLSGRVIPCMPAF